MIEGAKKREQLLTEVKKVGVSSSLLDNQVLPVLLKSSIINRDKHGWYSLDQQTNPADRGDHLQ
ncbi:MAG: hypothetical protein FK732_12935 [Asgard group archaeon]|nr:hypothetical protein [Asgard group archaeon]